MTTLQTKLRLTSLALCVTTACGDSAGALGGHIHIQNGAEPASAEDGDTPGHANGDGAHGNDEGGTDAGDGGSTPDAAQRLEDGGYIDAGDAPVSCVGLVDGAPCALGKHCVSGLCVADLCGDGLRSGAEECDDGNAMNTDGCTSMCRAAKCGDAFVGPSEECDDGNGVNTDLCTNICKSARCGDGIRSTTEACDDGNTAGGDGCSATCTVEATSSV